MMLDYRASLFVLMTAAMLLVEQLCHGVATEPQGGDEPWFTGPLLTPSARVIPPGHVNLEPYIFCNVTTGRYDANWHAVKVPTFNQINAQLLLKIGIIDRVDFTIAPQSFTSFSQGKSGSSIGDLPIGLAYLLYRGDEGSFVDYIKFSVLEIIPAGKYHRLDPTLFGTDVGGQGSFVTTLGLTTSKLFKLGVNRFFSWRSNLSVAIPSPVTVKGFSIFGGTQRTRGKIHQGASLFFFAGAEYTVTQRFSLACDFLAQFSPRKNFKGFTEIPIRPGETIQFSFAPAIEYNWSPEMGVIIGTWFSVAGKNSGRFINGVAAFNYYF